MTDKELIARLRDKNCCESPSCNCDAAADRIEALMKREAKLSVLLDAAGSVADMQKQRAERLEAALVEHNDLLRSALAIAKREGVEGQIASTNWDAYYNRVAVALKRHHQTANEARAAITEAGQ